MFPLRTLVLIVSACILAGCTVGPDYSRPEVPVAEHYQALSQRRVSEPARVATWWEGFGDPLLSQLVSDALAQNLDLAQCLRQNGTDPCSGAATAALLPYGSVSGQAARARQSVETPLGQVVSSTPDYNRYGNSYETDLNASWEFDLFGGLRRARQAALADYQGFGGGCRRSTSCCRSANCGYLYHQRGLQTRLDIANKQVITQQLLLEKFSCCTAKGWHQNIRSIRQKVHWHR